MSDVNVALGIDRKLLNAEKKKAAREEKELQRKRKHFSETTESGNYFVKWNNCPLYLVPSLLYFLHVFVNISVYSSSSSESLDESEQTGLDFSRQPGTSKTNKYEETEIENQPSTSQPLKCKRARKDMLTAQLAAALDKCKVSDRDAVHILIACVEALNLNPNDFVINRSSIKRTRERFRTNSSTDVKSKFGELNLNFL